MSRSDRIIIHAELGWSCPVMLGSSYALIATISKLQTVREFNILYKKKLMY